MATLSDIIGATAALRTHLRSAVGYPTDTVLLPDSTVDAVIIDALMQVNRDYPTPTVGTFTTVADQQAYTPLPATAYGYRRVYWPTDPLCSADHRRLGNELDPLLSRPIDEHGTRLAVDPSLAMAALRRASWLRRLEASSARIVGLSVYLDPVPSATGTTVYFTYNDKTYSAAADVHERHVPAFLKWAEHRLHERLAGGAGGVERVRDLAEGTDVVLRSPQFHADRAASARTEYHGMRPQPVTSMWP